MLITVILLALSVSIDAFGIGITYGLRKTILSFSSKIILFFTAFAFSTISVILGFFLLNLFSDNIIRFVSSFLLIFMGILIIYEANNNNDKNKVKQKKKIFLKPLGITIEIIKNPIFSDFNKSKVIEKNEALYLAFALSLDSICVGISCSSIGLYSLLFPLLAPIFQLVLLNLGIFLGKIVNRKGNSFRKYNIISGILLIGIGILRLLY